MIRTLFKFSVFFLFLGCNCGVPDQQSREEAGRLSLNIYTEPPTLDPGQAADLTSANVLSMVFEGLTRIAPNGDAIPAAAERIDLSLDGKIYTFHLRESRWTNGDPLTAYDFEYAWKRVLDPAFPAKQAYQFYIIKNAQPVKERKRPLDEVGFRALDSKTFEVELDHPNPHFLEMIASISLFLPIHESTDRENPDWHYEAGTKFVSNGPFFLDKWLHHNKIVVKANPAYWDASKIKLKTIVMNIIEDVNTELSLFEDGELDWTGKPISLGLPTDAIPELKKDPRFRKKPLAATYFFLFNTQLPPFNNEKMRKAFALAIDRQVIIDHITQGEELPAMGLLPPTMMLKPEGYFKDHDVKEARRLFSEALKELGMKASNMKPISLSYNTSEAHHKIAQAIQQQWQNALGVKIVLENQEWKVYLDKLQQHDFAIARLSWIAAYNDPLDFLNLFKYKDTAINHSQWEDRHFSDLLEEAEAERDIKKRDSLLMEAEGILMEAMPIAPVYFHTTTYLVNPRLKGYYITPVGEVDFRNAYFIEK